MNSNAPRAIVQLSGNGSEGERGGGVVTGIVLCHLQFKFLIPFGAERVRLNARRLDELGWNWAAQRVALLPSTRALAPLEAQAKAMLAMRRRICGTVIKATAHVRRESARCRRQRQRRNGRTAVRLNAEHAVWIREACKWREREREKESV